MDTIVPPEITAELTQILSNLVLGDNQIRSKYICVIVSAASTDFFSSAENVVNERLAQTPELYLLALAQFSTAADTEVVSIIVISDRTRYILLHISRHQWLWGGACDAFPAKSYDMLTSLVHLDHRCDRFL